MTRRKASRARAKSPDVLALEVEQLRDQVDGHADTLYGNGDRGLKERMLLAETELKGHDTAIKAMSDAALAVKSDARKAIYAAFGTIAVTVVIFIAGVFWRMVTTPDEKTEVRSIVQEAVSQTLDAMKDKDK